MPKLAIISGGSRGIGLAVAKYLAQEGYDLALIANNPDRLQSAKHEIFASGPRINIDLYPVDFGDPDNVDKLASQLVEKYKHIDLFYNNAGVGSRDFHGDTPTTKDWLRMLNINTASSYIITHAIAEKMKQQKSGYIINTSSMSGVRTLPRNHIYTATKYAVTGYTEALFKELNHYGVRVTTICPSFVDTDMTKDARIANEDKIQTSDIVNGIAYLLSLSQGAVIPKLEILCHKAAQKEFPL